MATSQLLPTSDLMAFIEHEVRHSAALVTCEIASLRRFESLSSESAVHEKWELTARRIEEETASLSAFISTLASIATEGTLDLEPTLMQRVIPRLVAKLEPNYPGRSISFEIAPDLPPVLAIEPVLETVIKNLLSNAHNYSEPCAPIGIAGWAEEDAVVLAVRSASRVTREELGQFFNLGFRSVRAAETQGSGVGLWECQSLLRFTNSSIEAHQAQDGGLIIEVRFGRADELGPELETGITGRP